MAERLKIKHIKFQVGSVPNTPVLDVETPHVTVVVGPNNSGKSQALREIEAWCQGGDPEMLVIDEIDLDWPDTFDDMLSMLESYKVPPPKDQKPDPDSFWIARPAIRKGENPFYNQVSNSKLRKWFDTKQSNVLREVFVRTFTLRLDGRTRFDLVDPKETGDTIDEPAKNHLWALFIDDDEREKVRKFTEEAFEKHFVIDPNDRKVFKIRLSDRKPASKTEEQALDATSRNFHGKAALISDLGDGVRASVGLVSAVMSVAQRILLIDEPEAFLHPTLARRVGRTLAKTARERKASLVAATHSAEFLYGCIQEAPDLRIVRLTFDENIPTARSIEPDEIVKLMNDPLLRSANALRALFHRGVVVTEADADRAFYDEINHRLLQNDRGIEDALFMNAQNWQTIPRIVRPLRHLGIVATAVFDFDVLMDQDFRRIWPLLHEDNSVLQPIQNERNHIKDLMENIGRETCKASGINAFEDGDKQTVEQFLEKMAKYGIFFVPVGELECWLADLDVVRTQDKAAWITNMFTELGSDPEKANYVAPGQTDVWKFIEQMKAWIADPNRHGIPL